MKIYNHDFKIDPNKTYKLTSHTKTLWLVKGSLFESLYVKYIEYLSLGSYDNLNIVEIDLNDNENILI